MKKLNQYLKLNELKLRSRLIITYTTLIFVVMIIITLASYYNVQKIIEKNIESELQNSSDLINAMIKTSVDTAIKNHLGTTSKVSLEITEHYYSLYEKGELSEEEAKSLALESIKTLKIGSTGYMYILDSNGTLYYHPFKELENTNISSNDFVKEQMLKKDGYIEYLWKNPDDDKERAKSLSMTYFEEWDWIISASSYKEEFYELIEVEDFEKQVLDISFGKDGYSIVIDHDGTFLIHPDFQGRNLIKENSSQGDIVRDVIETKNGIIEYNWQNPDDKTYRKKLMVFSELPEYNWIIASTSYKEDFYAPLNAVARRIIIISLIGLIALVFVTIQVSSMIIKPIKGLERTVLEGVNGNLKVRVNVIGRDEIAQLGNHFNVFMHSLEINNHKLMQEIEMRRRISEELEELNNNLEDIIKTRTLELEKAQKEIIEVEKFSSLNKLIKSIAHNINTPLGVCITSATYLNSEVKSLEDSYDKHTIAKKDMEEFFDNANGSYDLLISGLKKSAELVNMFKLLTRDQNSFEKEYFNVKKEIENTINRIEVGSNVLKLDCDDELEINSYSSVFDLIISNLIKNSMKHAFKFDESGLVEISVHKVYNMILLIVKDNGRGISEKDKPYIFEPFYRDESSIANVGLGLSIVYNSITHVLNGTIEVSSEIGLGTEFRLEIPIE